MSEHREPSPPRPPNARAPLERKGTDDDGAMTLALDRSRLPDARPRAPVRPSEPRGAAPHARLSLALGVFASAALVGGLLTIAGGIIWLVR